MAGKLKGKVAIVTGASSGLGWQSAVRLAEQGVKLCVTARREDALRQLARDIEARGGECLVVAGDVSDDEQVREVVRRCLAHYGRIDVLVNNAAVQMYAPFEQYTLDEYRRIFDVTFYGYLRFAWAVLPHFRAQGSGHVLNVLSMLSKGAAPLLSAYTAAKHALLGWSKCLRLELYGTGIEVSGLLVPSISSCMFDHAPTRLGRAPKPVPPTYPTDKLARAVVKLAKKPNPEYVPVVLQGKLPLLLEQLAPWFGAGVLGRWGDRMQMRDEPVDRPEGNLYEPMAEGVGPNGSIAPTPRWMMLGGASLLAVAGASVAGALAFGSVKGARLLRAAL
ncbi:MAG: SDR family NAD(P)-dependent oxidoreductase [Myxococcales bacterium]